MSIIAAIDWPTLNATVDKEIRRREHHNPAISVFRWWARRPHSVIRALLEAAQSQGVRYVADPFSGGGTVALEAAALGLRAYAQDLYPWPVFGLQTALSQVDPKRLRVEGRRLLHHLDPLRRYYQREDGRELMGILRVRVVRCLECEFTFPLYPEGVLSKVRRSGSEAYYGCRRCGNVSLEAGCACGYELPASPAGKVACPHCGVAGSVATVGWTAPLVLEDNNGRVLVRPTVEGDPVAFIPASNTFLQLRQPIKVGLETRRLHRSGLQYWGDLYSEAQAAVILEGLNYLKERRMPGSVRNRLAMVLLGLAEMAALLARWDRLYCKGIEGVANHRYAIPPVAFEANPLANVGRGVLRRRLEAAYRATDWYHGLENKGRVQLVAGSSERQALKRRVVDLVLTDPPYFDDVQYGEMAQLFHFWLGQYRPMVADEKQEAVPNSMRGVGAEGYAERLEAIFKESLRSLRRGGRIILSYHNRELRAWEALASALRVNGLRLRGAAVVLAESANDHSKRGTNAQLYDAILELELGYRGDAEAVWCPENPVAKNLLAVALALGEALEGQSLAESYAAQCAALGVEPSIC
ncbi:MAG: DNA methylase [Meiothermus sp.]|nr:MAG: DNA methylase [Meiothermus sp.]